MINPWPDRALSVEIECVGITPTDAELALARLGLPVLQRAYRKTFAEQDKPKSRFQYWQIMRDGTLAPPTGKTDTYCAEVASPIISTAQQADDLEKVLQALQKAGATVNASCAFQVHVDLRDWSASDKFMLAAAQVVNLCRIFEPGLDSLLSPHRRGNQNRYCGSLRMPMQDRHGKPAPPKVKPRQDYETLEFRALQGTLDPALVFAWIDVVSNLCAFGLSNHFDSSALECSIAGSSSWNDPKKNLGALLAYLNSPTLGGAVKVLQDAASTKHLKNTIRPAVLSGRLGRALSRRGRG